MRGRQDVDGGLQRLRIPCREVGADARDPLAQSVDLSFEDCEALESRLMRRREVHSSRLNRWALDDLSKGDRVHDGDLAVVHMHQSCGLQ